MKRHYVFVLTVLIVFLLGSLTGCLMRTYPKTIERVDRQIQGEGNQGYVLGTAPQGRREIEKETRQVQVLEIELRNPLCILKEEPKAISTPDSEQPQSELNSSALQPQAQTIITGGETQATEATYDTYIVKNNDTLQKIAARPEIYGDYKKWRKIFDANKDKLGSPDKIFAGQVLKIPRD